jgi:hypothetical protein
VDVLFGAWVADGVAEGVADVVANGVVDVDGGGCVGSITTVEFVFVGVLAVPCLFAVLDSGSCPEEETSARRRFSGCDS